MDSFHKVHSRPHDKAKTSKRTLLLLAFLVFGLMATACYNTRSGRVDVGGSITFTLPVFMETGSHAVEMWTEMHFQPSYRVQEGPRLLPPQGSVPVTGAEIVPVSLDEYSQLAVPSVSAQGYDDLRAQDLYRTNCLVCHGAALDGNGPIMQLTRADGTPVYSKGPFPADMNAAVTKGSTDGDLFAFISGGGRQGISARLRGRASGSPMPEFQKLLTEQERWELVQFLRSRIGTQ